MTTISWPMPRAPVLLAVTPFATAVPYTCHNIAPAFCDKTSAMSLTSTGGAEVTAAAQILATAAAILAVVVAVRGGAPFASGASEDA